MKKPERKPPKPDDARKMLAALTGDIARADSELDRVHQAAATLHDHHRDRANQAQSAIADYRPSHLTAEYLDHLREAARSDALANADGVLDHQAAGERLPFAKADQPSLFGPSPLIPVKKTVRRHTGTHVQTFHVRPAEQPGMFDPTAHVDARTHEAYDAGGGSTMTTTTEKPTAKHRVRMTAAQYAAAIEQRMDGGEHADGLKWDGHDLLVDDPAAVSATLTGMANGEDGQAEESDGDTRKHARGASTVLSNLALKVARLTAEPEPEAEPEFKDAGWVIPHSRKEEAAKRSLADILGSVKKYGLTRDDLADLEAEDPEEANKALTRGAVSAGRLRNLKALGMTAGAAFLTQHIVRRIEPRVSKYASAQTRQAYFDAVDKVTSMLANCVTVADVRGVLEGLHDDELGMYVLRRHPDYERKYAHIVRAIDHYGYARSSKDGPIDVAFLHKMSKQPIFEAGHPRAAETAADLAEVFALRERSRFYYPLGSSLRREFNLGYGDEWEAPRPVLRAQILEDRDDWSWAKRTNGEAEGGAWRRRVPAMPERVGPDEAPILDAEGLRTAFGIRGVQYGNYMDGDAAQVHTEAAGTALHDLAAALGIEPEHVSLNGRLSLAFGARGRGGKAAAHYERDTTAINLTKHAGSGTLAHEWGHFLDNILGRLWHENSTKMLSDADLYPSHPGNERIGGKAVTDAFKDVRNAIMRHTEMVPEGGEPYVTKVTDPAAKARNPNNVSPAKLPRWAPFRFFLKQRHGNVREAWDYAQRYYAQGRPNFPESELKAASITAANLLGEELHVNPQRNLPVENPMLAAARAMGAYWSRPEEMFARAFESFVTDKLAAMDRKNTYLVAGADEDAAHEYGKWAMAKYEPLKKKARGAPKGVIFSPYPTGSQRTAITVAFARLFIALREEGVFAKAIALMDARERIL